MTITILGTGYVGLTTAVLLAHSGHIVYAIEPNPDRLNVIKSGRSFFFEEGLDGLVTSVVSSKELIPTTSYKDSVPGSDVIFSCVGTPDNPDGSPNLEYIFASAKSAAKYMKPTAIFVQKSTVPVGTGSQVKELFASRGKKFDYVSNPEFLREGTALKDTLWFDRIVVGGDKPAAYEKVLDVYRSLAAHREAIAKDAKLKPPKDYVEGKYISTTQNSAELIKVTSNAFLALKISFTNSIAKLADKAHADIVEVMDAVGADKRIGRAFLNAGRGYGGGCFPKDVSGLISSAQTHGVGMAILEEAADINASMPGYIANKINRSLPSGIAGSRIAILGLAFKPGTSDARKSPAINLANLLATRGASVTAYDPEAEHEAQTELSPEIVLEDSIERCVKNADAVCVATDWAEFTQYDLSRLAKLMKGKLFVDAMNAFNIQSVESAGLTYIGVGRRGEKS